MIKDENNVYYHLDQALKKQQGLIFYSLFNKEKQLYKHSFAERDNQTVAFLRSAIEMILGYKSVGRNVDTIILNLDSAKVMVSMANSIGVVCLLSKEADVKGILHTVKYLLKSYSVINEKVLEESVVAAPKSKRIQLDEIKKMVLSKVEKELSDRLD
jgi:DNA-binding NarL/FixJ family response regulator